MSKIIFDLIDESTLNSLSHLSLLRYSPSFVNTVLLASCCSCWSNFILERRKETFLLRVSDMISLISLIIQFRLKMSKLILRTALSLIDTGNIPIMSGCLWQEDLVVYVNQASVLTKRSLVFSLCLFQNTPTLGELLFCFFLSFLPLILNFITSICQKTVHLPLSYNNNFSFYSFPPWLPFGFLCKDFYLSIIFLLAVPFIRICM